MLNERVWCLLIGRQYSRKRLLSARPVQGYDVALLLLRKSTNENIFERIGLIRHCVADGDLVDWTANRESPSVIKIV
jgi:hypothetical protein